jgi:hypothetical protein
MGHTHIRLAAGRLRILFGDASHRLTEFSAVDGSRVRSRWARDALRALMGEGARNR